MRYFNYNQGGRDNNVGCAILAIIVIILPIITYLLNHLWIILLALLSYAALIYFLVRGRIKHEREKSSTDTNREGKDN